MNENYNPLDKELNRLVQVIARLRAEDGCPGTGSRLTVP